MGNSHSDGYKSTRKRRKTQSSASEAPSSTLNSASSIKETSSSIYSLPELQDLTGQIKVVSEAFSGTYSNVYRGIFNGEEIAIKVIKRIVRSSDKRMQRKLRRERELWARMSHPNVLPLYGFAEDDNFGEFGGLISPWYHNSDAATYLELYGNILTLEQRVSLWRGVAEGVEYLHSRSIVHGDLKPQNVLIDNDGNPKICDFGLVRMFIEEGETGMTTTSPHTGTVRYLSPELLIPVDDDVTTTGFSDIWALGCVGLEFIFLRIPYSQRRNQGMIHRDVQQRIKPASRIENLDPIRSRIWDIIEACWNWTPRERPSALDICERLDAMSNTVSPRQEEELDNDQPNQSSSPWVPCRKCLSRPQMLGSIFCSDSCAASSAVNLQLPNIPAGIESASVISTSSKYTIAAQKTSTTVLPMTSKSNSTTASRIAANLKSTSLTSLLLRHLPPSPPPARGETRDSQSFTIPSLCVWCKVSPQFETQVPHYDRSLFCSKACHSLAQASAPGIISIPTDHPKYQSILEEFTRSWQIPERTPDVHNIYMILQTEDNNARYEAYRQNIESQRNCVHNKQPPANEQRRWLNVKRGCNLGDEESIYLCSTMGCPLCYIIKTSFCGEHYGILSRLGRGIHTSSSSSKNYSWMSDEEMAGMKVAVLNTVVVGRAQIHIEGTRSVLTTITAEYDSLLGDVEGSSGQDDCVVYDGDAILPRYLVIYV